MTEQRRTRPVTAAEMMLARAHVAASERLGVAPNPAIARIIETGRGVPLDDDREPVPEQPVG